MTPCSTDRKPDYIIDAIDTVSAKIALVELAQREHIPIISSMGTGNKLHPELFRIADLAETRVCPAVPGDEKRIEKIGGLFI